MGKALFMGGSASGQPVMAVGGGGHGEEWHTIDANLKDQGV